MNPLFYGADNKTWTCTILLPPAPQAGVSADSTMSANNAFVIISLTIFLVNSFELFL